MKKLMSNKDYHAHEAIGSSLLKTIHNKSVLHAVSGEFKQTDKMILGSLVHALVLEPESVDREFITKSLSPSDYLVNMDDFKSELKDLGLKVTGKRDDLIQRLLDHDPEYKSKIFSYVLQEFEKENEGKTLIKGDILEEGKHMASAVIDHPIASRVLTGGEAEFSYFSLDEKTGLEKKCRPDYKNGGALIDLKTTNDASYEGFSKQIGNLGYLIQAAYYLDVHNEATGENLKDFFLVAVENKAPYAVAVYKLDEFQLESGRAQYRRALNNYAEYLKLVEMEGKEQANILCGYPLDITTIQVPIWFLDQIKEGA